MDQGVVRKRVQRFDVSVPELVQPTERVRESFLRAMAEFDDEGRGNADDETMIGREIREFGETWHTPAGFATFVEQLHADACDGTPRPAGFVPCTTLWWVEVDEYLGRLAIRHRLTERLRCAGGHVGYDVRPSVRRRGFAKAMLRASLPVAYDLGIDPMLVTCDVGNVASRKVIEASGGVLDDRLGGKLRYWVPTRQSAG